ncbi:aminoglycoside phosphotransferase family protein [Kitasatospora sp. NPDC050463]|uniref:aminoglycoside phosphotransferase family protein n=1 Tax=Kitasatospora sp. NPDC050463 TaxID=3155786 RepID=UPI0033EA6C26
MSALEPDGPAPGAGVTSDAGGRLAACTELWGLEFLPQRYVLSFNLVRAAVLPDGRPVVLKLVPPGSAEYHDELAVLDAAAGPAVVRVLARDARLGAFLLERLLPGTPLGRLFPGEEERAVGIACDVLRRFWHEDEDAPLPDAAAWGAALLEPGRPGARAVPAPVLARARGLYAELASSSASRTVLHGDLHHANILSSERGWVVIDPKGLRGEPAFDLGAFLRNPAPHLVREAGARRLLDRRIGRMAELLELDRHRVCGWAYAQAVLSACWAAEDGDWDWVSYALACADLLAP